MREPLAAGEPDEAEGGVDSLTAAIRNEDVSSFWAAFSGLPAAQQEAFLLREFRGLSYAELALALGVSDAAVESLLFRARRGLQTALASLAALPLGLRDLVGRLGAGAAGTGVAVKAATATVGIGLMAASTAGLTAHHHSRHARARPAARVVAARVVAVVVAPRAVRPRPKPTPVVWHVAAPVQSADTADPAPEADPPREAVVASGEQAAPSRETQGGGDDTHTENGDQSSGEIAPSGESGGQDG